jgi:hypothetical protein
MKHIIDNNVGCEYWLDENNNFHRDNEPALIYLDGTKQWFKHGKYHRLDGPAIINSYLFRKSTTSPILEWYIDGENYSEEDFLRIVKMKELL